MNAPVLPISRKAYIRFTDRINRVYGPDTSEANAMITVLDRYLAGDHSAGDTLPATSRTAFAFLRQEIDLAIERSMRARERARQRRAEREAATQPTLSPAESPQPEVSTTLPATDAPATDVTAETPLRLEVVYETVPTYEILNAMPRQQPPTLSRKDRRALERRSSKKRNKPLGSKPSR
ncbi:hypothetical protein [uncultured Duncaniella sp.]|uniref:hypothetical protein n=1 Tax=uncultured Duncaniella sp. TaxID=2768039 RepID=UPI0026757761|nr:hypothetical protein [uncultured Duncaniella sp.]MCI9171920.1 hypothetical protein [Muribaculaceae bacterium]